MKGRERDGGEEGAVEGVGIDVEDRLPGRRAGGGEDGLREAGATDDHVEGGGIDGGVVVQGAAGGGVRHGHREISVSDGDQQEQQRGVEEASLKGNKRQAHAEIRVNFHSSQACPRPTHCIKVQEPVTGTLS